MRKARITAWTAINRDPLEQSRVLTFPRGHLTYRYVSSKIAKHNMFARQRDSFAIFTATVTATINGNVQAYVSNNR